MTTTAINSTNFPDNYTIRRLRDQLRKVAFPATKRASIEGDSTSFEAAFSNLAHTYIRDRAPKLLDHELGAWETSWTPPKGRPALQSLLAGLLGPLPGYSRGS